MRAVLTLFEGVATGAADGYARMADRPAATLLHLGPGLGNGLANLHNARKGKVPIVNIVGDHATYHTQYDAQLQSDIETVARNVSDWVRTSHSTAALSRDAVEAVSAAVGPPGQVATLILPADVSWGEGGRAVAARQQFSRPAGGPRRNASSAVAAGTARPVGGPPSCWAAERCATMPADGRGASLLAAPAPELLAEVFPTRLQRGAGLPAVERLAYIPELASVQLHGLKHLILVDTKAPVTFFAYPGKKSNLVPDGCEVHELAAPDADVLRRLARRWSTRSAPAAPSPPCSRRPDPTPPDRLADGRDGLPGDRRRCCRRARSSPTRRVTSGLTLAADTAGAPPHDVLALTGGAIGQGLPVAVGAAVACPDRPVIGLAGGRLQHVHDPVAVDDGPRAARCDRRHLQQPLLRHSEHGARARGRAGGGPEGQGAARPGPPDLDFVKLGSAFGVPSRWVENAEELVGAIEHAVAEPGPHLIEARVPSTLTAAQLRAMPYALKALGALPGPLAARVKDRFYP